VAVTSEDQVDRPQTLLGELQAAAAGQDLPRMLDLFTSDAVVLGTAAANLDRTSIEEYIARLFEHPYVVGWDFETVKVVDSREGAITFVALGTVGFVGSGEPREAFRLTCLAVDDGDRWRLRLFHGSIPAT
jgi:uncharacterized protein (TIGR02246 family)